MSIEFRALKTLGALRGATRDDVAAIADLPEGTPIKIVATINPRNERFHRYFFGIVGLVAENTDYTPDQVLTLIKIGIGHVDTIVMPGSGEPVYMPRSISFAKMDEPQFRDFVDRSIKFILQRILPGVASEDFERELFERLGIDLNNIKPRSEAAGVRAANNAGGGGRESAGALPSEAGGR